MGLQKLVVFLNKADATDKETIELVDMEVRDNAQRAPTPKFLTLNLFKLTLLKKFLFASLTLIR